MAGFSIAAHQTWASAAETYRQVTRRVAEAQMEIRAGVIGKRMQTQVLREPEGEQFSERPESTRLLSTGRTQRLAVHEATEQANYRPICSASHGF
jgi:hypothetical protein